MGHRAYLDLSEARQVFVHAGRGTPDCPGEEAPGVSVVRISGHLSHLRAPQFTTLLSKGHGARSWTFRSLLHRLGVPTWLLMA